MNLSNRQNSILNLIRSGGKVEVDELAAHFDVTTQTIRRDLNVLSGLGLASRIHGGAQQAPTVSNVGYEERRELASAEKQSIGSAAAALIPNDCSIMLNVGTTTEQVARSLFHHTDLMVVTNNVNIVNTLKGSPSKELILAGGTVRESDGAIVGEAAVEFMSRFKVDFAIIGASALDVDGAVLDFDAREVSVARAILKNARTRILVSDYNKFERTAPLRICEVADVDYVVTDKAPPQEFADHCKAANTTLIVTDKKDQNVGYN